MAKKIIPRTNEIIIIGDATSLRRLVRQSIRVSMSLTRADERDIEDEFLRLAIAQHLSPKNAATASARALAFLKQARTLLNRLVSSGAAEAGSPPDTTRLFLANAISMLNSAQDEVAHA